MRKTLFGLLALWVLLAGCGDSAPIQTAPATETTLASQPGQTLPTQPRLPLLEQGIALEEGSALRYIPNPEVESMTAPEVRLMGNGLLLSEFGEKEAVLKHISLEDGALIASARVPADPDARLYVGNGEIALCDRVCGKVLILDEALQVRKSYTVTQGGEAWCLDPELDTLYIFFVDRGLMALELCSGASCWLVENSLGVTPIGEGSGYAIFCYTDREDQRTYTRCLNLTTATMETLPANGAFRSAARQGESWLLQSEESDYLLVRDGTVYAFSWEGGPVRLQASRRHLLLWDLSGRELTLCRQDGTFLSRCALPQSSNAAVTSELVWSGYWQGYFFTDYTDPGCRLMFWDVAAQTEGQDLVLVPGEQAQQVQYVVEPQLYARAEQLGQRFGVEILIAQQCALAYSHYDTYALTDPVCIRAALNVLEAGLSRYPEGFFRQLAYGSVEAVRIELVGGLVGKQEIDTHPDSVGAFAQKTGSRHTLVIDGFLISEETLFHEVSHIIDARLEWDAMVREDALFSEEAWLALQPEGFSYAMHYTQIPEALLAYVDSGDYFITEYAMTYPTEDRAVLMASAMRNEAWCFEPGSGQREKMKYYAACIRDCFDTEGWPEMTAWEAVLE